MDPPFQIMEYSKLVVGAFCPRVAQCLLENGNADPESVNSWHTVHRSPNDMAITELFPHRLRDSFRSFYSIM